MVKHFSRPLPLTFLTFHFSLCFLVSCSSPPQLARWELTGGPMAQNISTVFVDEHNKSHLFVGLTNGEVHSSTDEGGTWSKLTTLRPNGSINRFIQHPDDVQRYYAATNSGLFVSTDAGVAWTEITINPSSSHFAVRTLVIDPYNARIMYTGIAGIGIHKSTDGGATWRPVNNGLDSLALTKSEVCDIKIDPSKPDNLYATMREVGVIRSTDGGASWTRLTSIMGSGGIAPTSIVVHSKSPGTLCFGMEAGSIYKSVDGGKTWSPTRFGSGSDKPVTLISHPDNPGVLYAGAENDILISTDFGTSWKSIAGKLPHVASTVTIAPGKPVPTLYAYGEGIGLNRSANNGVSWIQSPAQPGGSTVSAIVGDKRGTIVVAAVGASVHRWTTATRSWTSASNGLTSGSIVSIAMNTDSSTVIHVATSTGIYGTLDGGYSWSSGSHQLRGKPISLISSHPIFPTRMLASTETEVLVSTNTGFTWNPAKPLNDRRRVRSFTYSPSDAGLVLGATAQTGAIISTNGGLSWEANRYGLESKSLDAITLDDKDKLTLYAWTDHGEGYRSTDKGLVWNRYSPPWQTGEQVHIVFDRFKPSEVIALVGANQLYYSRSGGGTWIRIPCVPLQGEITATMWNSNTATLYVGIRDIGVYRVALSEHLKRLLEEW